MQALALSILPQALAVPCNDCMITEVRSNELAANASSSMARVHHQTSTDPPMTQAHKHRVQGETLRVKRVFKAFRLLGVSNLGENALID